MSAPPERWLVLAVRVADPELLPLAAEALVARGSWAVQEAEGGVVTYVQSSQWFTTHANCNTILKECSAISYAI